MGFQEDRDVTSHMSSPIVSASACCSELDPIIPPQWLQVIFAVQLSKGPVSLGKRSDVHFLFSNRSVRGLLSS